MTKKERIKKILKGEKVDRFPFSVYRHSTVHERRVDSFAEYTLGFFEKYDPDYVKVMFDENYDTPVNWQFVPSPEIWEQLKEFECNIGSFGRQVEALKIIKERVEEDVPVIQTIFSPFHFAYRLADKRVFSDLRKYPELVKYGLGVIANNIKRFAECCIKEAGIDGFFFGAYGCEPTWMSENEYEKDILPFDMDVIDKLRESEILILHIHGEQAPFFNLLKNYSVDAISWEDKLAGPSIEEALSLTDKCLVGGINHIRAISVSPDEIKSEVKDIITRFSDRKIIIAPGCTLSPRVPEENILAIKEAILEG